MVHTTSVEVSEKAIRKHLNSEGFCGTVHRNQPIMEKRLLLMWRNIYINRYEIEKKKNIFPDENRFNLFDYDDQKSI